MSQDRRLVRAVVRGLVEEEQRRKPHPAAEVLLSYHLGELEDLERDRVQAHVAVCSDCTKTLLDLADFPEVEHLDPLTAPSDEDVRHALQSALEELRPPRSPLRGLAKNLLTLAASLFFAIGSTGWLQLLRTSGNPPLQNISTQIVRAGPDRRTDLVLRFEPSAELLSLTFEDIREGFPEAKVVIRDTQQKILWQRSGFVVSELQDISLGLYPGFLEPGEYELEICGIRGEITETLRVHTLYIE